MKKLLWLPLILASCETSVRDLRLEEDLRRTDSADLRAALSHKDPAIRSRAALAMGRIQSYLPELLAQLRAEKDILVQRSIVFAIGQQALSSDWKEGDETEAADAVAECLKDPQSSLRLIAVEAMGKLRGPKAVERLGPMLRDPSPDVRGEAAIALFRYRFLSRKGSEFPALPPEVLNALAGAGTDEDPGVRWRVAYAFTRFGDKGVTRALQTLAGDTQLWCRLFALRALAGMEGEESLATLAISLRDPEEIVRTEAVGALTTRKAWKLFPAALAQDPSFHVRAAYARALANAELEGDLGPLLRDRSLTVRCEALASLARRIGARADDSIAKALQDPHWKIRMAAAKAARTLEMARAGLADPDPRVRAAAIEALGEGELVGPDAQALVIAALGDKDVGIRGTAVDTLPKFKEADQAGLLSRTYRESLDHKYIEVRESIAGALEKAKDEKATALLKEMLDDPEASVRASARAVLRKRGIDPGPDHRREFKRSPLLEAAFKTNPTVVVEIEGRGSFEIECFAHQAPIHVANFVRLCDQQFYEGKIIHRVVSNFVVQGGDPLGSGMGDAGYSLRDEINQVRYDRGTLGMPKAGKDTGGCQFFITHTPTPHLDGQYTAFGRVVRGLEVIDAIEEGDKILHTRVRR